MTCDKLIVVRVMLTALLLCGFGFNPATPVAAQEPTQKELEDLDFANGLLERGLHEMAISEYESFLQTYPASSLRDEVFLGIAESFFYQKEYAAAEDKYLAFLESNPQHPKRSFARLRLGQVYFFTERYSQALTELQDLSFVELEPPFDAARDYFLGKSLHARGRLAEAKEWLERAALTRGDHEFIPHAFVELGDILIEEGRWSEAVEMYAKAYRTADNTALKSLTLFKQGEAQYGGGFYEDALSTYRELQQNFPGEPIAVDAAANALLALFRLERWGEVISGYEGMDPPLPVTSRFYPVHLLVADAWLQQGEQEAALEHMRKVRSFDALTDDERLNTFLKQAETLLQAEKYAEAMALLDEATAAHAPDSDTFLYLRAEAKYGMGLYQEALRDYLQVSEQHPSSALVGEALLGAAHSNVSMGEDQKAIEYFVRYFYQAPVDADREAALYNAFVLALKSKSFKDTVSIAQQFLKAFPESERQSLVLFQWARVVHEEGEIQPSIDLLRDYLESFPDSEWSAEAIFMLGYAFEQSGDTAQALAYYQQVPEDDQAKGLYYTALKNSALLYLKSGEDAKAVERFAHIIRHFPDNDLEVNTYFWLAEQYLQLEQHAEAEELLRLLHEQRPDIVQTAQSAFLEAEVARKRGQCEEALSLYDHVLAQTAQEATYVSAAALGKAQCLLDARAYDSLQPLLEDLLRQFPDDHTVTMRARYLLGEAAYLQEDWAAAAKLFLLVAVLYEQSELVPPALLKAAESLERSGKNQEAFRTYQDLIDSHPQSEEAQVAQERISGEHAT